MEALLEVRANGGNKDDYHIFIGGAHTNTGSGADLKRAQIQRTATAIRRNKALVEFYDLLAHLHEDILGQRLHKDTACTILEALSVLVGAEQTDFTILATESLETLKDLLTIVEATGSHVQIHSLVLGDFDLTPLAVLKRAAHVVIRLHVTKRQMCPVNVF